MNSTATSPTAPEPVLLRGRTVMAMLDISETTLWRMVACGELQTVRLGKRCTRFPADAVRALAARSTSQQEA